MREPVAIALTLVVLTACPSDDGGGDTGAGPSSSASTMMEESGGSSSGSTNPTSSSGATTAPEESSSGGSGEPGPPVINMITWTQADGCMMSTASDVTIVVDVTDPDNSVDELTFSGMITGCTGTVDGPEVTIVCPQVATYTGEVEVEDPDGNTDSLDVEIEICTDGSATP